MPAKICLDEEKIVELYEGGLSALRIGKIFNVSKPTILNRLEKRGICRRKRKYSIDENIFSTFTPASCYWAGFIAADGWIQNTRVGIELNSIDRNHLIKFYEFTGCIGRKPTSRVRERNGHLVEYNQVGISSKAIVDDLDNNFNIIPRKSCALKPPTKMTNNLTSHFIRGYFDGDGHIGWHTKNKQIRITFLSGSEPFIKWIRNMINNSCFVGCGNIIRRNDANTFVLSYNGNKQVKSICNWIFSGTNDNIVLDRKIKKYNNFIYEIGGNI